MMSFCYLGIVTVGLMVVSAANENLVTDFKVITREPSFPREKSKKSPF